MDGRGEQGWDLLRSSVAVNLALPLGAAGGLDGEVEAVLAVNDRLDVVGRHLEGGFWFCVVV